MQEMIEQELERIRKKDIHTFSQLLLELNLLIDKLKKEKNVIPNEFKRSTNI